MIEITKFVYLIGSFNLNSNYQKYRPSSHRSLTINYIVIWPNVMFIVHKFEVEYFEPEVTENLTAAQARSNICHLPKPEGWWHLF